jgi:diguanylate cyclase (GGDEF)-like protein/PAS domain S-box-containing protein
LTTPADNDSAALEELLQFLYLMPVGVVKFRIGGEVDLINPVASQLLQLLAPTSNLTNVYEPLMLLVPDLRQRMEVFAGDVGAMWDGRRLETRAGGKTLVLEISVNRINDIAHMMILRDVTLLAEQERKLFADQQRFRAIFDHVRDYAIYTITLDGQIDEWNQSLQHFGGWLAADVQGASIAMFFPSDDQSSPPPAALLTEAKRVGSVETEGWRIKRDGSRLWGNTVITALPDESGSVRGFAVVSRDMSERKRMEDELKQLATIDPLTGAFNRRYAHTRLVEEFARRARSGHPCAVMMLDIDKFKSVNDSYGHDAGDAVLCAIVTTCKDSVRTADITARWGGEEFLILLPDTDAAAAVLAAERLREAVAAGGVSVGSGTVIAVTVSIGVAVSMNDDLHDLLHRADSALYMAKSRGRNQVVLAG